MGKMPQGQLKFSYTAEQLRVLETSLSRERLSKYIGWAGGDLYGAIRLYERNTALSEGLYGAMQGLEVQLRNSLYGAISDFAGSDGWYDSVSFEPWEIDSIAKAKKAAAHSSGTVKPGKVVAELTFGFWVGLTASIYEKRLWVPSLHKAFPFHRVNRRDLYAKLDDLRRLRNRIAHHEPILDKPLVRSYQEILQVSNWINPVVAEWIDATNCFVERWNEPVSHKEIF